MLSTEQLNQFEEKGYLLLSGLIPKETVKKAEQAMWHSMGMDADNPATWEHFKRPFLTGFYFQQMSNENRIELFGLSHPDILACSTPDYLTVLKQLAERYPNIPHCRSQQPDAIWAMNQFPIETEWSQPKPHLDGHHRDLRLDPGTFRTASITYLTDANPQQGTTIIWSEGPHRIREFRKKNPQISNHVRDFHKVFAKLDMGEPTEIVAEQGDVLFFHHLLPHSGTLNVGTSPRFAIRYMCLCYGCRAWQKKGEWNIWMP